jgi:hypothetical protein
MVNESVRTTEKSNWFPVLGCIAILFVLLAAYPLSYVVLSDHHLVDVGEYHGNYHVRKAHFWLEGEAVESFYAPLVWADRRIRPKYWAGDFYGSDHHDY